MRPKMFANLHETLEAWLEDMAEENELPAVVYPENLAELMARAAAAVFDAAVAAAVVREEEQ